MKTNKILALFLFGTAFLWPVRGSALLNSAQAGAPGSGAGITEAARAISPTSFTWIRTGGPPGGLGYDVRMRPDNPDVMYVTDAWAGVFASKDGGATWSPSNTGIAVRSGGTGDAIPIFCLTIDPTNPNIVWAGMQYNRAIYKSTDGGATWTKRDNGVVEQSGITFRGITVDPTDSDVVYAAGEISSWAGGQPERRGREFDMVRGVVYKTTDGGRNWKAVWRGNNLARYVWIDPRDTNVLYVSTGIFDREAANSDPATGSPGGEGVLKSTDGGQTWTPVNNGLNNLYVGSLFMHPTDPDILIAGTGNNQYRQNSGVYRTTDGGATWTQTLVTGDEPIESVEISASDPNIAYAGGDSSVYRSEDGGQTWTRVSGGTANGWGAPGIRAGFPIDFQVDPRNPDRVFANEYGGGNFLSEDGGRTWADASRGYTGAQVRAVAVDPNEPGRVVAAARSGIFVSNDGGATWSGLNYPPVVSMEWNAVAIDPTNPQHLIAETNWGNQLINSLDGGMTWRRAFNFGEQRIGWHAIVFAPSDSNVVYAGSTGYFSAGVFDPTQPGRGVYVSRDGGKNWSAANNALSQDASVYGLAVDARDAQVVYAATSNHGLLKTTNAGQDWQTVQGGLPQSAAFFVAINPADANVILAGFERRAIYRSADGGQTWSSSARGMSPEAQITSIVFAPTGSGETVYASDFFGGVYRSSDGGRAWSLINDGLLMRSVNGLAISSDGLHLYAASEGGGAFRIDLDGQPPRSAPTPTPVPSPTNVASTSTPIPFPTEAESTPTPTPSDFMPCGGALIMPAALLGLFWKFTRKR
ncbi:MAG: YCF48-related protein [Chloroflexota bacterium]